MCAPSTPTSAFARISTAPRPTPTFPSPSTFRRSRSAPEARAARPILYVAIRFLVATLVLAWVFRGRWRLRASSARGGVLAGVCLFGGYAFQTVGLKSTTPSKAAFLTGLTVVVVPLLNSLVYRVYPHVSEAIGVVVATIGMGLMTLQGNVGGVARGDIMVILCAVAFAAH